MADGPVVTVGLPVYNGERFLRDALDSVLAQTFTRFRLVISDNGSTDATQSICAAYAAVDPRVEYIRQETNRGAAWNWNAVSSGCETPFFKWVAADDMIAPTFLERCVDVLSAAPPDVVLCYPRALIVDEDGNTVREHDDGIDLRSRNPAVRLRRLVLDAVLGNPVFGLYRTGALLRTRGHGNFPSADYVLLAELALQGQIWELPERLLLRREHAGSSRAAHRTAEELSVWFDPEATPVRHERSRLRREYVAAIAHADLRPLERVEAYALFAAAWLRRSSAPARLVRRLRLRAGR